MNGKCRYGSICSKKGQILQHKRKLSNILCCECCKRRMDIYIYTSLQKYPTPSVLGKVTRIVCAEHVVYNIQQHNNWIMIFCHRVTSIP